MRGSVTARPSTPTGIRLIDRAFDYEDRVAFGSGESPFPTLHTYADLLNVSEKIAGGLLQGSPDLEEERIAFLIPSGFEYAAVQWGIWRAGGIAVPLSPGAKEPELKHMLTDAGISSVLLASNPD